MVPAPSVASSVDCWRMPERTYASSRVAPSSKRCGTSGLTIDSRLRGTITVPAVSASDSARSAGPMDLILVCVKTQQLPGIMDDLAWAISDHTVIVPLQNGVEADDHLATRFPQAMVLPAVVYVGATLEQPGRCESCCGRHHRHWRAPPE
jgi:ketopantoate reductase